MTDNLKDFYLQTILRLIKETPNDFELGKKLRVLYCDMPEELKPGKVNEQKDLHRV